MNRPREIEVLTNLWFVHPLSRSLARLLAKTPVHPNVVSLTGLISGLLAAYFYFNYETFTNCLIGFGLMIVWHILDGTDGQLARMTGKATMTGKIIDGIADYSVFILVTTAISVAIYPDYGFVVIPVYIAGAFSHIYQSAAYERQREDYMFLVYYDPAKKKVPDEAKSDGWRRNYFLRGLYTWYLGVQERMRPGEAMKSQQYAKELGPKRWKKVQDKYREMYAPHLRYWSLVSANTHTAIIFLSCAVGMPILYLLTEIVVFNIFMAFMFHIKSKKDAVFHAWLKNLEKSKSR